MKTALFLAFLSHISLASEADVRSPEPCMLTKHNQAHNTFLKRHVAEGAPSTDDQNGWETFLRKSKFCHRPTQSFLPDSERERVNAVCASGGKLYKGNLCISKEPFSFITVRVEQGTCGIRKVVRETKHLILACEKIENHCKPVHFEGNPENIKPDNNHGTILKCCNRMVFT
uniref:Ribonuclease A-domain domain-containing protein n=1 Tax=Denticeps clupeoides TaxID=299321 RepID=A0AAY4C532_9TELE